MIRTLTYRARLDGKDGQQVADAIRAAVAKRVRIDQSIRGVQVTFDSEVINIALRMSGLDRWRIAGHARKIASFLLASQRLAYARPLYPFSEITNPSSRQLTLEQGRTPQSKTGGRPSTRSGPGTAPQTRSAEDWWGDELPQ